MQIQEANNILTYDLVELYNSSLKSLLDQHAPLQNKTVAIRQRFICTTGELLIAKRKKRQLERKWQNSKLTVDHQIYRNQCIVFNKILCKSEQKFTSDRIQECKRDQKKLFRISKQLLGETRERPMPKGYTKQELPNQFGKFFFEK